MIRRPPRSTQSRSSAASDVYKRQPVLITALLSAIILNFFFIPPRFTLHINSAEDVLMFAMYFVVALINAVLTFKIRQFERKKQNEQENEKTIQLYNCHLYTSPS